MHDCIGSKYLINGMAFPVSEFDASVMESDKQVYEVLRVEEGIPLFIENYLNRLQKTIKLSGLRIDVDLNEITEQINKLISLNDFRQGPVKLMISPDHTIIYLMKPYLPQPSEYFSGVKAIFVHVERTNPNAKIWNPNFRNKVIQALDENAAYEAILINQNGEITEGSRSNVFFTSGNEIYTAPAISVLPGITRMKVLEICAAEGIKVNEGNIHLSEIENFDSVFITGTSRKVLPVRQIDEKFFKVENELVSKISACFEAYTAAYIHRKKQTI
jgi:branched-chain amino acid aminotransferase